MKSAAQPPGELPVMSRTPGESAFVHGPQSPAARPFHAPGGFPQLRFLRRPVPRPYLRRYGVETPTPVKKRAVDQKTGAVLSLYVPIDLSLTWTFPQFSLTQALSPASLRREQREQARCSHGPAPCGVTRFLTESISDSSN
jgi:hypothetical protein